MKHCLRRCLILLICLALPLAGTAGIQAPADPCPMRAAGMTGMTDMMDMGHDCCEDMGSHAKHGNPCKPGQECKTASLLQVAPIKPPITFAGPVAPAFSSGFLPARTPSAVWRPPRV